ncbi:distal membrane-arm assembly complex protein 2 [Daktulosphaira vitifoliae]|uniref:distal membrane-arm assembly complex protein 2 n=1 Tax=Daktulosphaira vitifoliae TaxID=58002 RepID=UPI0021AA052C|nr:distal membrane-arm assembly complex protein 2 [Daktulosphaira vitifoliae]
MNSLRRLLSSNKYSIFYGKKKFSTGSENFTEDEKQKLYDRLMNSKHNENDLQGNTLKNWLLPDQNFSPSRIMSYDWSMKSIGKWYEQKKVEYKKYSQRYVPERVKALGTDLAAAHFIVYRGGAVKFVNHKDFIRWENKKEEYCINLPEKYDASYRVDAIDASNLSIYYEGLENFKLLYKLKWLSLRNNPVLDDWSLDLIGSIMPSLEYLDISNCKQISCNGIAGLQKLRNLKELVVNNEDIEFQMACFALEDILPELFVSMPQLTSLSQ